MSSKKVEKNNHAGRKRYPESAERIKIIRESTGLTQVNFGQELGIPPHSVKDMEAGYKNISPETALILEEKLGYSFKWILTGVGETRVKSESPVVKINQQIKNHYEIIKKFNDHEKALRANKDLVYLEKNDQTAFEKALSYIEGLKSMVPEKDFQGEERRVGTPKKYLGPERRKKA